MWMGHFFFDVLGNVSMILFWWEDEVFGLIPVEIFEKRRNFWGGYFHFHFYWIIQSISLNFLILLQFSSTVKISINQILMIFFIEIFLTRIDFLFSNLFSTQMSSFHLNLLFERFLKILFTFSLPRRSTQCKRN